MSLLEILSYIVTGVGVLMCGFFLAFIFLGKRLAGERGARQIIKYKGLELRTSSLVTVLMVAVAVTLAPLGGLFWLESHKAEALQVFVVGRIEDESGKGLKGATATLSEINVSAGDSKVLNSVPVESDGSFGLTGRLEPGKRLKLETAKPGYRKQTVILGLGDVNFASVLVKE